MTQYVINIGTVPNDGTGDPLRTAFNEVNLNFDQVFNAGPVLSNIQIANNTILTTNTNGNLVLAPNGIGVVQANVNIVPNSSNIRNLGSADRRWSTIYLQYANISGSITVSDLTATGNVTVGGNLSVTGNIINVANIITDAKTIQLANTAGTANAANGSGVTVGANDAIATFLFDSGNNTWDTNIGLAVNGPITGTSLAVSDATIYGNTNGVDAYFTGTVNTPNLVVNNITSDDSTFVTIADGLNVQGDITASTVSVTGNVEGNYFIGNGSQLTGLYANANAVAYGQAGWAGNIVPAASNTYSLGNSSLWWSNIWVSGNTIYIGGVPIGMSAGNVMTVNGNAVLQNDSNTTISTTGNITADYFFGNGSQLTGIETSRIFNGDSNVEIATANGNVTVTANGSSTWNFATDGNLTTPSNLVIGPGPGSGSSILQYDDVLQIVGEGANAAIVMGWAANQSAPDSVATIAMNFPSIGEGNVLIAVGNNATTVNYWKFGTDGQTIFPTLTVTRGDRTGTLTGQALIFGDSTQEALISTPNGTNDINDSQRLVINPGAGAANTSGEGGDIYLYAGRGGSGDIANAVTGGSGGDIKIRGGLSGPDNSGGYITMEGGEALGNGVGGYIEIFGGVSGNSTGGYLDIRGGQGITGGDANITGGVGTAGPGGAVNIVGGTSSNGLAEYGNVNISAGASTWTFDNTGNLTIIHGSRISEVPSPVLGNYALALTGTGVSDPDQQLLIYPTTLDANHLHLTSGNLYNTELFLGNDDLYVKLANTGNVVVNTNDTIGNTAQWTFGADGNLSLPQGGIINEQANPDGFPGHAIVLTPTTVIDPTQQLWIYPTGGSDFNHLHLTSGNLYNTELFLGNDNLYVKLANTGNIQLQANDNAGNVQQWTFGTDGVLNLPYEGILQSTDDTVTLRTFNTTTGNANSVYLGTSGGLGFFDQEIGANWLEIFRSGTDPQIATTGNLLIRTDSTNTAPTWTFGANGTLTAPGNISAGNFVGAGSNVDIVAGSYDWTFDNTGNLTAPGIITANTFVSNAFNVVTAGNLKITSQYGLGFTGTILEDNGDLEVYGSGSGGAIVGWTNDYNSLGNVATVNFNTVDSPSNVLVRTGNRAGTEYNWTFVNDGNLVLPGNTFAVKYANGTAVSLGGAGSYGNANVATFLAAYGSNTISTTGNVTAANFIGNIEITGNISGTSANVELVAGVYEWTFDNTGNLTLPGNSFTVNYANGTAVSLGGAGSYGNANVADFLDSLGSNAIVTTGNITGGNVIATANILGNGYARLTGSFDESQASTAGLYLGYAGGTARIMFGTGNTSQTLEIDNDGGTLRFYKPGTTLASLTNSGAFSAAGNITGANIVTGGSISATGNITAANLGNIASINLNGNSSQVLYGNGVFAAVAGGGSYSDANVATFLGTYGSNTISSTGNITTTATANVGTLAVTGNATVTGTGSNLIRRASGLVAADTNVTLDDLSANVTSSGSQLAISTSGSWQGTGWTESFVGAGVSVQNWVNLPMNPGYAFASQAMNSQGHGCRCVISDQTPTAKVYQITVVRSGTTGAQWNITIERLV